jgi:hypothetical protein
VSQIPELERALAQHPDDCDIVRRLLGAYVEDRQYVKTFGLLERLASIEAKPVGQARHYCTMAQIARDHLANYSLAFSTARRRCSVTRCSRPRRSISGKGISSELLDGVGGGVHRLGIAELGGFLG